MFRLIFSSILKNNEEDKKYPFRKIEDFIEASKLIEITDILDGFKIGYPIDDEWKIKANNSEEMFKEFWKPILHFHYGFCYMFQPKEFPVLSPYGQRLLTMVLNFDVGFTLLLVQSL